ncbi:MAG: MBL fold metallo-hydrolase [Bacteroidota bacterium]|nr:MBL fold metallo-hydrolase [Bacteroidota bacterium]
MKATFLGTGTSQGVPLIGCKCLICQSANPKDKRLRSSIKIEVDGQTLVIDSGPDFRQQMLRSGTEQLDALIFTHEHKDHIAGMDDIRAFNYINKKAIDVYASLQVQRALKREYQYIFADIKYPGIPEINLKTISKNESFLVQDTLVTPIEVFHYMLPVLGFRINDFTYITDANFIAEEEKQKIRGSKVLVLNALRNEKHISHYTLSEAIALAQELEVPEVYFTHISHQLGLHEDVTKELPQGIYLAYDGLEVKLDRRTV